VAEQLTRQLRSELHQGDALLDKRHRQGNELVSQIIPGKDLGICVAGFEDHLSVIHGLCIA
jgi:hypothetical protein